MTAPTIPAADPDTQAGELEDVSFGRAIVIGSVLGILAMIVLIAATMRILAPDQPWGVTMGIAVWAGVWAGLFLGGTVTVGRWSAARH